MLAGALHEPTGAASKLQGRGHRNSISGHSVTQSGHQNSDSSSSSNSITGGQRSRQRVKRGAKINTVCDSSNHHVINNMNGCKGPQPLAQHEYDNTVGQRVRNRVTNAHLNNNNRNGHVHSGGRGLSKDEEQTRRMKANNQYRHHQRQQRCGFSHTAPTSEPAPGSTYSSLTREARIEAVRRKQQELYGKLAKTAPAHKMPDPGNKDKKKSHLPRGGLSSTTPAGAIRASESQLFSTARRHRLAASAKAGETL